RLFTGEDGAQRAGSPLPERALERPLLAQGLVPAAAGRALLRERADAAAWNSREAHGGAEVHQRLRGGRREDRARPLADAADVDVLRQHVAAEREARDRVGGVAADAGKRGQIVGPALRGDLLRRAVEVERATVVAEALP